MVTEDKRFITILAIIAIVIALMESYYICYIRAEQNSIELMKDKITLLQDNIDLRKQLHEKDNKLAGLYIRLGASYKNILAGLIHDLGLDRKPDSAATMMLEEFSKTDKDKAVQSLEGVESSDVEEIKQVIKKKKSKRRIKRYRRKIKKKRKHVGTVEAAVTIDKSEGAEQE